MSSKAEERASELHILMWDTDFYNGFVKGYDQAEKDLELSWEDIRIILGAENDILRECNSQKELVIETYPKGEDYYGEILKRFKERKENAKVNV